jgi:anti-sigma factor RsiW
MNATPTCRDGAERLMEYMDGALDESLRQAIDAHLAGCARCQAFVRSYAAVPAIVREATQVTLGPQGQEALRRALTARHR